MIDVKSWIEDSFAYEAGERTELVKGLTPVELKWQPRPQSRPIGWTLWRMTRVEDFWVQYFTLDRLEVWELDQWYKSFGLPAKGTGLGHTPDQIAAFPGVDLSQLMGYWEAVRAETMAYLKDFSHFNLDLVPRKKRPEMSVRAVFRYVIGELHQHLEHLRYISGLLKEAKANLRTKANGYWAVQPPSITNSAPVTYADSSDAK